MFRQNTESLYGPPVPTSLQDQVERWGSDEVIAWLRGLDDSVLPYIHFFEIAGLEGEGLLLLTHGDLQDMGITSLGVRQIILQATELLSDLCYNLETENLQSLGLLLSVKARHLQNVLQRSLGDLMSGGNAFDVLGIVCGSVSYLIHDAKRTLSWLDRSPFDRLKRYLSLRERVWSLSVRTTAATQDLKDPTRAFQLLQSLALEMEGIGLEMVRGIDDPLILATSYLDRAILKRSHPQQELGLNILSSVHGVHVISQVHLKSPADVSGKIDAGDEILQLNGQTVVGWDLRKLIETLGAEKSEIEMILKKRPRELAGISTGLPRPRTDPRVNLVPTQPPANPTPTDSTIPPPETVKFRHRSTSFSGFEDSVRGEESLDSDTEIAGSMSRLGVDGLGTRRYTVCGGNSTNPLFGASDRRTSLSPDAENSWLDSVTEQRKKSLLEVPILNNPSTEFVRNYRLSITHHAIRPMSYVNSELLMPAKDGNSQNLSDESLDDELLNDTPETVEDDDIDEQEIATVEVAARDELLLDDIVEGVGGDEWDIRKGAGTLTGSSSSGGSVDSVHVLSDAEAQLLLEQTPSPYTPALSQSLSTQSEWGVGIRSSIDEQVPPARKVYGNSADEPEDPRTHSQKKLEKFFGDSLPAYATLPRSRPEVISGSRTPVYDMSWERKDTSTPRLQRMKYIGTDYRTPVKGPSVRVPGMPQEGEKSREETVVAEMWSIWRSPAPSLISATVIQGTVSRSKFPGEQGNDKWQRRHLILTPRYLVSYIANNSQKAEAILHTPSFRFSVHDPGFRSSKKFVIVAENSSLRVKFSFADRMSLSRWMGEIANHKNEALHLGINPIESFLVTGGTDRPSEEEYSLDKTPLGVRLSDSLRRSFRFREGSPLSRKGSNGSASSTSSATPKLRDPLRRPRSRERQVP